jgi:hypothetical protein
MYPHLKLDYSIDPNEPHPDVYDFYLTDHLLWFPISWDHMHIYVSYKDDKYQMKECIDYSLYPISRDREDCGFLLDHEKKICDFNIPEKELFWNLNIVLEMSTSSDYEDLSWDSDDPSKFYEKKRILTFSILDNFCNRWKNKINNKFGLTLIEIRNNNEDEIVQQLGAKLISRTSLQELKFFLQKQNNFLSDSLWEIVYDFLYLKEIMRQIDIAGMKRKKLNIYRKIVKKRKK